MITSIAAKKAFDKIQHILMIKNSQQTRNKVKLSQLEKNIYQKPVANILLHGEMLSPKIKKKARMFSLLIPKQHCTGSPSQCSKKNNKMYTEWKGRNKTIFIHI